MRDIRPVAATGGCVDVPRNIYCIYCGLTYYSVYLDMGFETLICVLRIEVMATDRSVGRIRMRASFHPKEGVRVTGVLLAHSRVPHSRCSKDHPFAHDSPHPSWAEREAHLNLRQVKGVPGKGVLASFKHGFDRTI